MIESGETGRLRVKGYKAKKTRITASKKRDKVDEARPVTFSEGQQVDLVIGDVTPIGYMAVINGSHRGVLYKNEVFQPIKKGQAVKGYIKKIREDGKIDLSLHRHSLSETKELSLRILDVLKKHDGSLNISDKSSPERIYNLFGVSKKQYKNAIGALYKRHIIVIDDYSITLAPEQGQKPINNRVQRTGRRFQRKPGKKTVHIKRS